MYYTLLEELSELVYVADVHTYELLYINRAGRERFGIDEQAHVKCHKALQGLDAPCPFCTNRLLRQDAFYNWEYTNPVTQRHYLLKDRLIDWMGRIARLEIAFDTTASEHEKMKLKNALDAENLVTECARLLYEADSDGAQFDMVLQKIGVFLESDRTYIFEIHDCTMDNTFEWCREGVAPQIENLQGLPVNIIDRWQDAFAREKCICTEDVQQLHETNPDEYELLRQQDIHSMIAAPIFSAGRLLGYVGVDNYATRKLVNAPHHSARHRLFCRRGAALP